MRKLHRLITPVFSLFSTLALMAVPARRSIISVTSPSGLEQKVYLYGDENFHYYVSADDGALLIRDGDTFHPADFSSDGRLHISADRVNASQRLAQLNSPRHRSRRMAPLPGVVEGTTFPAKGKQKAVVVLVEYQDVKFNLADPADYFSRMLNEEGFSDYYATGSARDWYLQSSCGQFEPEFDVFGPVTLQKNREYYGGNDAFDQDSAPQKMVIEACRQLNATVDFSEYDRDEDGYIDNVFVVYAGRGEASGGSSDCVWPHAWYVSVAEPGTVYSFDGVRLDHYACCNEWELSDIGHGYRPVGIGTFVHEFSHVMGLPDLYSTKYVEGTFTAGAWSAMDYGPYNNDGCTPPQYSAWERASLGYFTPTPLPDKGNVAIKPLEQGDAYIIPTDRPDEFFILENRQQSGWDSHIPGHGMLIWHIDYDADVWSNNAVNNNPAHNHVDIMEADNLLTEDTRAGDSFPGTTGVTTISASTTPALKGWNGFKPGVELTDITETGTRIVFRLNGGSPDIETPVALDPTDIKAGGFTANWQAVDGALSYILTVYTSGGEVIATRDITETSCVITNLTPSTEYSYSVRADDGFYGSAPSEVKTLCTLDPTFDYFAPTALDASQISTESFLASWEEMEGATDYFVTVEKRYEGEKKITESGFDGGIAELPAGWSTTSAGQYGMSSYAGEATPSLRLSTDGDNLTFTVPDGKRLESISFWHRGNSTTSAERLSLQQFNDGQWEEVESFPIQTAKGGQRHEYTIGDATTSDAFRIVFIRPSKGAVAIDDVKIIYAGDWLWTTLDGYDRRPAGNALSLLVDGLEPATTYAYTILASDGEFISLPSQKIEVETLSQSSLHSIVDTGLTQPRLNISGRTVSSEAPFDIHDVSGRRIACGCLTFTFREGGLYIVSTPTSGAVKIAVN